MKSIERREVQIFNAALEKISAAQQAAYLDDACAGDEPLRKKVQALLRAYAEAESFFGPATVSSIEGAKSSGELGTPTEILGAVTEQAGATIGRYKLREKIGEGGCGVVYVAEQEEPVRRRVALKVIKLGMDTKSVVARFEAERQALAMMDHPNIAKVLDAGATETGRPYFVMELVRGIRITDYCDQNKLPTRARLDLFIQVCRAVQHAHQKGIIHRDLKPSNILVTLHDGVPVPKVIDFGIAKATEGRLTDLTIYTELHQFIGTPVYMSPEQAEMSGLDIDTRSDIYSLGVLLYELLTGKTPFDAKELLEAGLDEMRRTIREREPLRPSTRLSTMLEGELTTTAKRRGSEAPKLIGALRGDLDWIVMKSLEKDRTRRYETANGLAVDLQRHLSNEPVVARPPTAAYKVQKFVRRNKVMVSAAVAIVTVLVSGVIASTWLAIQASRARSAAVRAQAAEREQRLNAETQREKAVAAQAQAEREHQRVEQEKRLTQQQLYSANLNLVQLSWEQNNLKSMQQLLEETASSPERGFEWYYWQRQMHAERKALRGHHGSVLAVAISPDGQRIATGGEDHMGKVWDSSTGLPLLTLEGHKAEVRAVAFSADGRRIITGSLDETARVWDSSTGSNLLTLKGHSAEISSVAISRDGRWIATGSYDQTAKVYDASTGFERLTLKGHTKAISGVAFSPDGAHLATASNDGTAKVWELSSGNELLTLQGHSNAISSVAFSPDGLRIATGSKDQTAKIWQVSSGRELLTLKGHRKPISSVAFFPEGERVLTGSYDQTARVWDASEGRPLRELKGHRHWITSVAISANGDRVVTGSQDETAKIWDLASSQELLRLKDPEPAIYAVAIFPDGPVATGIGDANAVVWEPFTGRKLLTLKGHTNIITSIAFSPDGRRIATGSKDQTAKVWSASTGEELITLKAHSNVVTCVAFSPDGQRIATGSEDRTAIVWDASSGKALFRLPERYGPIRSVAFSPDSRRFIVGGQDKEAKVYDASTGRELLTLEGGSKACFCVAVSPDGLLIATGDNDGTARVLEAGSGKLLHTLIGHSDEVRSVAFSPDGQRVLTSSRDKTARVWMAASGRELLTLKGHNNTIVAAGFSQDGRRIFTGALDRTARVWKAATPDQVAAWQVQEEAALSAPETRPELSQRAKELLPEFFCLCDNNEEKGCGLRLDQCECGMNPGERKKKAFIESLVDLGKSNDQIRKAMVARYGEAVKFSK